MVIFFGAAGSGKSVQGQLLAARHHWRWLSVGQLLRDTHDHDLLKTMSTGDLVDDDKVNAIVAQALSKSHDVDHVIIDGFPRHKPQAQWLIDSQPQHGRSISLILVLDVPHEEIVKRLKLRARSDDTPQAIEERLEIYEHEVKEALDYFEEQGIKVVHVDGIGSIHDVHERLEAELQACSLV